MMKMTLAVEHRIHVSDRSFDEVIAQARSLTGSVEEGFSTVVAGADDRETFESRMHEREGESEFMRFFTIDHGAWLNTYYGITGKAVTLILGNPLVALTMLRHEIEAGLNVPYRLMISEAADGSTHVSYDLPSTLMSSSSNPDMAAAARALDEKIIAFAERISGSAA